MATIAVLGTFDTKGEEHGYVAELIRARGHATLLIDVGSLEAPRITPDVPRTEIADAAGTDLARIVARRDRGEAVAAMTRGAPIVVKHLQEAGRIDAVISLGGGGGTAICTAAMRALPVGFPKLMVSTLASGNTAPYVGVKDIVMMPSVVDVAGLNRISRTLLAQAAGAICGMAEARVPAGAEDKPVILEKVLRILDSKFGLLERAGYEVMIFAATGNGGRTLESLAEAGLAAGVLDITTTEWADELVGGVLTAGPTRCDAAARRGIPAIFTPGCLDMVNFGEPAGIPDKFKGRRFYHHNAQVTLMRTNVEECTELGRILAWKCNASTGPVSVLLPLRGISVISAPGQPFHWPEADAALFGAWKKHLRPGIPVIEYDGNINDPAFAELCVSELQKNIAARSRIP